MNKILLALVISVTTFATGESLKKKYLSSGDELAYYIISDSGVQRSLNADKALIPASTFKVFSAYYILNKLGADFKFETSIGYNGKVESGVLQGDLILNVSADPYLLTSKLYDLIDSLRVNGIKAVSGNLIINSNFVELDRIGNVGLEDQPYNQGISGFNLNFNRFKSIGRKEKQTFPIHKGLTVTKSKTELSPGLIFKNTKSMTSEEWTYTNSKKYYIETPIRNTMRHNSEYFAKMLENAGFRVKQIEYTNNVENQKKLHKVESLSSLEMIRLAMEYSNNLFIETLMLKATAKKDLKSAAQMMQKELALDIKGELTNSSGLSTNIMISPKVLVNFINKSAYKKFNNTYFINLFSITGHSGSLYKKYLTQEGFEKIRYKTGSLDYVYNICGKSFESNSKTFCVMINNPSLRNKLDGKNSKENEGLRQKAKQWRKDKERFSELLLYQLL